MTPPGGNTAQKKLLIFANPLMQVPFTRSRNTQDAVSRWCALLTQLDRTGGRGRLSTSAGGRLGEAELGHLHVQVCEGVGVVAVVLVVLVSGVIERLLRLWRCRRRRRRLCREDTETRRVSVTSVW